MIKFIFFDMANTLVYKDIYLVIKSILKSNQIDIDINLIKSVHQSVIINSKFPIETTKEFYYHFNSTFLNELNVKITDRLLDDLYEGLKTIPWKLFDDVKVLDKIVLPKGIISNWDSTLLEKIENLPYFFDPIIYSSDIGISKPDKRIFQLAFDKIKCDYESILYVGDSVELDIKPVLALNAQAILIDRDNMVKNFKGLKIRSLYELLPILKNSD